jgi:hypothetical protein
MENLEIQKRIINLGKMIVTELSLEPGVDTLGRWMSHYIAEQIVIAENSTGDNKLNAEQCCFDTILQLWKHRAFFSNGRRPFENYEPILRVLERLEKDETYFFENIEYDERSEVQENVKQWLDMALDIDNVARVWLNYVFRQAASGASDAKTMDWLNNSANLQENDDSSIITRLLLDVDFDNTDVNSESIKMKKREETMLKIKKLEAFGDFNQKLLSIFHNELKEISEDI